MTLKEDFSTALFSQADFHALLELVGRHQARRLSGDQTYDALEEIWLEHGFSESEEESPLRDNLEYVMEKAWYQGGVSRPRGKSVTEK
jgi:hypothetical protein